MDITFLGGGNEIGASSALVEIGAHRILVDCGVRMSGDNVLPDFGLLAARGLPAVDAVVQTHAHFDHSGALPVFHQQYPATPVYMTPPTQALISILLQDSLRIAKSQCEAEADLPPFPPAAVDSLMTRIMPVPFDTPITLGSTSLVATWFPAGHILGAAAVGIEGNDHGKTVRVLFSGDLAVGNQLTVPGMPVPSAFRRPDVLVIESTYGNRLHSPRQAEEQRLLQWLASILDRQGTVLIPAFAIGRAQELALLCIRAMRQRHMAPFPVYLDGMVRAVCRAYTDFPAYQTAFCQRLTRDYGNPFLGAVDEVRMVAAPQEREKVLSGPPCVIIASSGMLSGGASADYAPVIAQSARNAIAITGYQDEESPGRRLLDLAAGKGDSLLIGGRSVAVQCDVTAYSLSAHADADELTRLIDSINPREVVLVHGDGAARTALADRLYRSTNQHRKVHLPRTGDTLQFGRRPPVRSPASQPAQVGIGQGDVLDTATLPRLVEHLLTRISSPPWSPAALLDLWYGTGSWDETHFATLVALLERKPPGLRRHPKRPQLYQVIDPAAPPPAPAESAPPRWTEHDMGVRIAEVLGADPDLYHVGFHLGMRQVRLRFAFPEVAAVRYREQFARLVEGTGWTVHLNKLPHQERLAEAACALVPDGYTLRKPPALHMEHKTVALALDPPLPAALASTLAAALGSQVIGSIIRPASFCGCIGFKPSVGGINRGGSFDHFSQSCTGVLGATLADTWTVARAMALRAGGDPGYHGLSGPIELPAIRQPRRIALLETAGWPEASAAAKQALIEARQRLQAAGIEVIDRTSHDAIAALETAIAAARPLSMAINAWEGRWPLNTYASDMDRNGLSSSAQGRLAAAQNMSQAQYQGLLSERQRIREVYAALHTVCDACMTLAAPGAAPIGLDWTGNPVFTVPTSLLGVPSLSLPVFEDDGLPLGLQLVGFTDRDADVFSVASAIMALFAD